MISGMIRLAFVILVLLFPAATTGEGGQTGNVLLANCEQAEKAGEEALFKSGLCLGYIEGVLNGWRLANAAWSQPPGFCAPPVITKGQSIRIVTKYLREHPASLHMGAETLVTIAFVEAYPCPSRR